MSNIVYVFDCLYHGRETGVFCFRAFGHENRERWKKLQVESIELPLSEEELNTFLNGIKRA